MLIYNIFLDESGTADPKTYLNSPYFSLSGIMVADEHRKRLKDELNDLKLKYFGKKSFILHSSDLRFNLKRRKKKLEDFSTDLKKVFDQCPFFILYVIVNKEKAKKQRWNSKKVYSQTYTILLSNMLKFLSAKKIKGQIFVEASNAFQDMHIYNAFFHLIRRGIERLSISGSDAKKCFTSLCFVTKINNDAEEQVSDLFGVYGRLRMDLKLGKRKREDFDSFEELIYSFSEKRLFKGNNVKDSRKKTLYKAINSCKILP